MTALRLHGGTRLKWLKSLGSSWEKASNDNLKWADDSAERIGAGGQSHQIARSKGQRAEKRGDKDMEKKITAATLCAALLALCLSAEAQQRGKVPVIGRLGASSPAAESARIDAFRHGLRELGYIEGENIRIAWRHAEGKFERLPALAAELVRLKVDVIVTGGEAATRPAKEATTSIPIVMTQDDDPVATGFVASLARPGGNITGLSTLAPERSGKRLELLKEIVPRLSRVAVFGTSTEPSNARVLKEIELAAGALGIKIQFRDVLSLNDLETAFRAAAKERAGAVLMDVSGPITNSTEKRLQRSR
jgi:putative ABC transport system substrate-binding protein